MICSLALTQIIDMVYWIECPDQFLGVDVAADHNLSISPVAYRQRLSYFENSSERRTRMSVVDDQSPVLI
jgi:hypothetical protein